MIWIKRLFHNIYLKWNWYAIREVILCAAKIILIVIAFVLGALLIWSVVNPPVEDPANFESDIGFYGEMIHTEEHYDYTIEYRRCLVTDQVLMMYRESSMYNTAVTMCYLIDPNTGDPMLYDTFMEIAESRGVDLP